MRPQIEKKGPSESHWQQNVPYCTRIIRKYYIPVFFWNVIRLFLFFSQWQQNVYCCLKQCQIFNSRDPSLRRLHREERDHGHDDVVIPEGPLIPDALLNAGRGVGVLVDEEVTPLGY